MPEPEKEDWRTPMSHELAAELLTNPASMRQYVIRRSRLPFQEVLARLLQAEPTIENVRLVATEAPEKWTRMVRDMAALSGYKDGLEIDATVAMNVSDMSDAELLHQIQNLKGLLENMDVVDGEFYEVEQPQTSELPDYLK